MDPEPAGRPNGPVPNPAASSSSVLLFSLELSDTTIYEPRTRALLGTAAHFSHAPDVDPEPAGRPDGPMPNPHLLLYSRYRS